MANTKKQYLAAIMSQRTVWTEADEQLASQLAGLRFQLERVRVQAEREPATVQSAAGTQKANPIHGQAARLAKEEAALTRRLGLGLQRTSDNGRSYKTAAAPGEVRALLWYAFQRDGLLGLVPGEWAFATYAHGCYIESDAMGYPDNPAELPVAGRTHAMRGICEPDGSSAPLGQWEQHRLPSGELWASVAACRDAFQSTLK